jgi:preprotein translocase subunit SecA
VIGFLLSKIFGSYNERHLRRIRPVLARTNALEPQVQKLGDAELRAKTDEFRRRLGAGQTLNDLLPEAFAVVREAARRTVKMRPFDVQIVGGVALHKGMIAEMATGEGKTLVATMPAYLNALTGDGVHVVTVNDYLARRDRDWMGPIYEFLGLTVGVIQHGQSQPERQAAYRCDITYGTNNEFGFDYLRDNMVVHRAQRVQRGLNYGIVDEVDSILVDEARTPLIISGPSEESTDLYYRVDRLIPQFAGEDYQIEEKTRTVALSDSGVKKSEKFLGVENLYEPHHVELVHHVNQALRAHKLFKRDVDYVVQNGEVIIVDEFTGRLMPGRRYSDGLHQALEAKEKVKIEEENQTLATVTFQNFFRMYKKVAGMTGTAATEAQEFHEIYKLPVLTIPTNRPLKRKTLHDRVYRTEREKFDAVVRSIAELHKAGRPVLVGTISIEKSEHLSGLLQRQSIPHTVLNAKYHEKEAEIIKRAGQKQAVTIATNMAGRGTDIVLGEGVAESGGLHVLGTERHESRRIDNQLRGRAGRQGDPGSSEFFLSLEDDLLRIFGSDRISGLMQRLGLEEGQEIQHGLVTRAIETAQTRVEARNFEIRKQLLKFDDVMNLQRQAIYGERRKIIDGEDVREYFQSVIEEIVDDATAGLRKAASLSDAEAAEKQRREVLDYVRSIFSLPVDPALLEDADGFREHFIVRVRAFYAQKEREFSPEMMRRIERFILLEVIDSKWKDHLRHMDDLREGIGLRAYGQKDPVVEYRTEAFQMFEEMTRRIKEDATSFLFRAQPLKTEEPNGAARAPAAPALRFLHPESPSAAQAQSPVTGHPSPGGEGKDTLAQAVRAQVPPGPRPAAPAAPAEKHEKVGRNEPCPCGSGKKYKKCHGA